MRGKLILVALAVSLLAPAGAAAAGSGSFSPTGSMNVKREQAAFVPLSDGRILVAGGDNSGGLILDSAEIYSPSNASFSAAGLGTMTATRTAPAAARLPDGRVLIAGGFEGSTRVASAEVFLPGSGTFSAAGIGSMGTGRAGAVAVPLLDGRTLVAGGCSGGACTKLASAEVYNAGTNTFSSAGIGSMATARTNPAAARLPDGRVLVVGGYGTMNLASTEIFNPATNTFSAGPAMSTPRGDPVAGALPDGRVLVAGGFIDGGAVLDSAEVYDPKTNSFSTAGIGSLGTKRGDGMAATLPDGRVLVAGGYNATSLFLDSAEIYSATNAFSLAVKGKSLTVSIEASGEVSVSDAAATLTKSGTSAATAKKRKGRKPLLLKTSTAKGDPPAITVPLLLSKAAKAKLRKKGKVTVRAKITFAPAGGLSTTQTAKLKIKGKKPKKR